MTLFPLPSQDAAQLLLQLVLRRLGGAGSGNFGHAGRPGAVGGSGEGSEHDDSHEPLATRVQNVRERIMNESHGQLAVLDLRAKPNGDVELETIAVAPHENAQGAGTKAMNSLTQWADDHGVRLILSPSQKGYQPVERGPKTSSTSRLKSFYKRFGFVEPIGRHYDPTLSSPTRPVMFRDPKKSRSAAARPETLVHAAADKHLDEIKALFVNVFASARATVNRNALKVAIVAGDKQEAQRLLAHVPDLMRSLLLKQLPIALLKVVVDGGRAGMAMLPVSRNAEQRSAADRRDFTATDPRAIEWAREHATELIDDMDDTTREAIQEAIASGLEGDLDRDEVVDDILDVIDDEDRASMIAHTETMDAANEGLAASWDNAVEEGLLPADVQKRWIATGDDNMCDECEAVNGEVVDLDDDFSVGDDPPLHPHCRCTMGIVESSGESSESADDES
jgi:SPP1 gp7 family putative phage head morphogenesis protein